MSSDDQIERELLDGFAEIGRRFREMNPELAEKQYRPNGPHPSITRIARPRHQWVYYLKSTTRNLVKIGTTRNVEKRMRAIQAMNPEPIVLLAVEMSYADSHGRSTEIQRHHEWRKYRSHGEWFYLAPEISHHIEYRCMDVGMTLDNVIWNIQEFRLRANEVNGKRKRGAA